MFYLFCLLRVLVFGTTSIEHPYINYMVNQMSDFYVGGPIVKGIQLPQRNWLPFQFRVATPTGNQDIDR